MTSVVRCRANSQLQTTILCRVVLDVEQTLNYKPLSYVQWCQMQSKLSLTDHSLMSSVVRCRRPNQSKLNNRTLSYVECCQMQSKLSITDLYLMSRSVVRCRANSQYLMSSGVRCRANSQLQTTILCRVLLDVEQTLDNRTLSYVECCQMQSKLSITDHYLMSSVVRC